MSVVVVTMDPNACSFEGCDRTIAIKKHSLCDTHYCQLKRGKALTAINLIVPADEGMKRCCGCKKDLPIATHFGGVTRIKDYCRPCARAKGRESRSKNLDRRRQQNREAAARRYIRNRDALDVYCIDKHCVDCGETDSIVFEFDHVRGEKKYQIGDMLGQHAWSTILDEISKCDIRCANCHRRKTAIQLGWRGKGGDA